MKEFKTYNFVVENCGTCTFLRAIHGILTCLHPAQETPENITNDICVLPHNCPLRSETTQFIYTIKE